jgi:hypothetical protein
MSNSSVDISCQQGVHEWVKGTDMYCSEDKCKSVARVVCTSCSEGRCGTCLNYYYEKHKLPVVMEWGSAEEVKAQLPPTPAPQEEPIPSIKVDVKMSENDEAKNCEKGIHEWIPGMGFCSNVICSFNTDACVDCKHCDERLCRMCLGRYGYAQMESPKTIPEVLPALSPVIPVVGGNPVPNRKILPTDEYGEIWKKLLGPCQDPDGHLIVSNLRGPERWCICHHHDKDTFVCDTCCLAICVSHLKNIATDFAKTLLKPGWIWEKETPQSLPPTPAPKPRHSRGYDAGDWSAKHPHIDEAHFIPEEDLEDSGSYPDEANVCQHAWEPWQDSFVRCSDESCKQKCDEICTDCSVRRCRSCRIRDNEASEPPDTPEIFPLVKTEPKSEPPPVVDAWDVVNNTCIQTLRLHKWRLVADGLMGYPKRPNCLRSQCHAHADFICGDCRQSICEDCHYKETKNQPICLTMKTGHKWGERSEYPQAIDSTCYGPYCQNKSLYVCRDCKIGLCHDCRKKMDPFVHLDVHFKHADAAKEKPEPAAIVFPPRQHKYRDMDIARLGHNPVCDFPKCQKKDGELRVTNICQNCQLVGCKDCTNPKRGYLFDLDFCGSKCDENRSHKWKPCKWATITEPYHDICRNGVCANVSKDWENVNQCLYCKEVLCLPCHTDWQTQNIRRNDEAKRRSEVRQGHFPILPDWKPDTGIKKTAVQLEVEGWYLPGEASMPPLKKDPIIAIAATREGAKPDAPKSNEHKYFNVKPDQANLLNLGCQFPSCDAKRPWSRVAQVCRHCALVTCVRHGDPYAEFFHLDICLKRCQTYKGHEWKLTEFELVDARVCSNGACLNGIDDFKEVHECLHCHEVCCVVCYAKWESLCFTPHAEAPAIQPAAADAMDVDQPRPEPGPRLVNERESVDYEDEREDFLRRLLNDQPAPENLSPLMRVAFVSNLKGSNRPMPIAQEIAEDPAVSAQRKRVKALCTDPRFMVRLGARLRGPQGEDKPEPGNRSCLLEDCQELETMGTRIGRICFKHWNSPDREKLFPTLCFKCEGYAMKLPSQSACDDCFGRAAPDVMEQDIIRQVLTESLSKPQPPPVAQDEKEDGTCIICFERPVTIVLVPCGHLKLCHHCSISLKDCPLCRRKIDMKLPVFK